MADGNNAAAGVVANNAAGDVAEGGNDQQAAGAGQNNMWGMMKGFVFRLMMIYFVSSLFSQWSRPKAGPGNISQPQSSSPGGSIGPQMAGKNLFPKGVSMDVWIFLSPFSKFTDFDNPDALFWHLEDVEYGDWTAGPTGDGHFTKSLEMATPEQLKNNGSLYLHVYISRENSPINPRDQNFVRRKVVHAYKQLNKYKKKKYQRTTNLLTGETEASLEHVEKAETIRSEVLNYWHPNITLSMVDDQTAWMKGSLPPPLDTAVKFDPITGDYYPIFYFNDYWNLNSDYQLINETVERINLTVTFAPMSLFKWQLYASQTMRNKWTQILSGGQEDSDDDQDSLKQAILETNPYLLGATILVSLLHTVFEFLAFKNDIQFWRSRKSLEGLSVRSILFNVFTTVIVLLYVLDNDTNFVVRASIGIGLLIELWKIPKVLDVSLDRENRILGLPRPRFADKGTYVESNTKEYDRLAFKYLSWLLFPLLGGYCVYSLMYHEHRGWYSFILSMLYGFLLMFGFIMMTPQLFINYKLKSVAHLPWRMLTYKFLNTFIDDIFAFVIKMPTMYRLGCFRDDIVFLIYVYQRWIYRVDPTRINEFGTTGLDPEQQRSLENNSQNDPQTATGQQPAIEHQNTPAIEAADEEAGQKSDVSVSGSDNGSETGASASEEFEKLPDVPDAKAGKPRKRTLRKD